MWSFLAVARRPVSPLTQPNSVLPCARRMERVNGFSPNAINKPVSLRESFRHTVPCGETIDGGTVVLWLSLDTKPWTAQTFQPTRRSPTMMRKRRR